MSVDDRATMLVSPFGERAGVRGIQNHRKTLTPHPTPSLPIGEGADRACRPFKTQHRDSSHGETGRGDHRILHHAVGQAPDRSYRYADRLAGAETPHGRSLARAIAADVLFAGCVLTAAAFIAAALAA